MGLFRTFANHGQNSPFDRPHDTFVGCVRGFLESDGAEEAQEAVNKSQDLRFLLARVVERCQQALARTPDMLPVLKQAGVVDAGGQGLVHILEGMLGHVLGEYIPAADQTFTPHLPPQAIAAPVEGLENPYDVQYLLVGDELDVMAVRHDIDAMGDSTVVVGDETTIKVHIHVKDPGVPLSYGVTHGKITDVVVENMQLQMEEIIARPPTNQPVPAGDKVSLQFDEIGVVAVAAGEGLADIFRSLGAAGIVNGGQSNNPSTEEILDIVQSLPCENVIILPNNKNIILAAEAAGHESSKQVTVVPTRTAPQGISAILSFNRDSSLEEAATEMEAACQYVASGEIAVATRSVVLDGVAVEEGQIIGVVDGRLCASGPDVQEVLQMILANMTMDDRELVSIYYGQDVSPSDAEKVAHRIQTLYPDLETEVLRGGQAIYQYILGAE